MKKKILVIASTFPRYKGDTEPCFVLDYCKSLLPWYEVTALVPATEGAADNEVMDGVSVIRYHYFPVHKWETLCYPGAIMDRIKKKKERVLLVPFLILSLGHQIRKLGKEYDLIHAHWLIPQGIVCSFQKYPYLLTGHGTDISSLNKGIMKKLKARCLKKAAAVTTVSSHLQGILKEKYQMNQAEVLPMGCDTSCFSQKNRKENFFSQGEKKVILFVGRLAEIKGIHYLIEAMTELTDCILVIAGDGEQRAYLEQLAANKEQEAGLEKGEKIRFLGAKSHDELGEIYASADVFVMPSITLENGAKEGLGLVAFEAMASGLPVVASSSGGIVDVIRDGENGLLIEERNPKEIAKKIRQILTDEKLYEKLVCGAIATAKSYSYEAIGARYAKLIQDILERSEHE